MAHVHVRSGDQVLVIAGKDKGKKGKVVRVLPDKGRVVVEGVNIVKKHRRPTRNVMQGGILEEAAPIDASNVMLVCRSCGAPARTGAKFLEDGRKVKVCRRCGEVVDR